MHLKSVTALATAALTAALTLLVAPAADASGDDVTWAVRTASNSYGAARTSFHYTVSPGGTLTDAITVANQGDEPLDLGVYAADGFTTDAGQLDLVRGDQRQRAVGAWARTSVPSLTIAPGETRDVPFTISVPKGSAPGDYAGGIVTTLTQPDQAKGITVDRRLGIRISLRVSGKLQPALAITAAHARWHGGLNPFAGGDATLGYTITNTGNTTMDAAQAVTASGPFGLFPAKAAQLAAPPSLLPGESRRVTVPIRGVAAAFWFTAMVSVTPKFVDAAGSINPPAAVSATATGAAVPWGLLLVVLVIAALVVGAALLQRRRRGRARLREDERVRSAVEQALAKADEKAPADS